MLPITDVVLNQLSMLSPRDYIEIIFFSTVIYYLSLWIAKDRHKNLLLYFYSYCAVTGIAYIAQLTSICFFLTFFAPVILICFIVLHETTLQKNYVTLRNTITPKKEARDWLEQLIRICLNSMNNTTSLTCIIEQSDHLSTLLKEVLLLEANLHTGILEMLIKAPTFDSEKIVWINKHGTLVGINAQWKHSADHAFVDNTVKKMALFKQDALLYTAKTDAIFFRSNPMTHTFDIIVGGTLFESVSAHTALKSLKKHLNMASHTPIQKGEIHGTANTTTPINQTRNQKQHRA